MDNFEQKIVECVNEKLNDGTVERLIEEKLEKAISSAIEDVLSYSGKGKKLLVSKVEETIVPVIERHDFNQYLVKLDSVLTEIINNTTLADNKTILENFETMMKAPVESLSTVPLSKIYDEYKTLVSKNIDTDNLEIDLDDSPHYYDATTNMELEACEKSWFGSSSDQMRVKFSCDEDADLNCEIALRKRRKDGKYEIAEDTVPLDVRSLRNLNRFEVFIQCLKRSWSKIEVDIMDSCGDGVEIEAEPEASFS